MVIEKRVNHVTNEKTDQVLEKKKMKRESKTGVFSCGTGTFGELAQGLDIMNSTFPALVSGLPNDVKCIDIKCGSMHTIALLENGEIYSAGSSDNNANGRNPEIINFSDDEDSKDDVKYNDDEDFYFRKVDFHEKVIGIEAGHSFSAILDIDGYVWVWGVFTDDVGKMQIKNPPKHVSHILHSSNCVRINCPEKIVKISAGNDHLMCLSRKGQIFTLGSTSCGQIGRFGKKLSEERAGRNGLLKLLNPHVAVGKGMDKFKDIFASVNNSSALGNDEKIYSCGLNVFHQTSLDTSRENVFSLTKTKPVDYNLGKEITEKIKQVSFGLNHSAILTESNTLYICGKLQNDLIGTNVEKTKEVDQFSEKFIKIDLPGDQKCKSIMCGPDCTAAITFDGKCFVWGTNSYGNLSQEKREPITTPTEINSGNSKITKVFKVSFAYPAMFIIAEYD